MSGATTAATIIMALSSCCMAVFSFLLWKVDRGMKELEEKRLNPKPQLIKKYVDIAPQGIATKRQEPVLRVGLWLSNPGDNSIYLKELKVESWRCKNLLLNTSTNFSHNFEARDFTKSVIAPRKDRYVVLELPFRSLSKQETLKQCAGQIRLSLSYSAGTKESALPIDYDNVRLLD